RGGRTVRIGVRARESKPYSRTAGTPTAAAGATSTACGSRSSPAQDRRRSPRVPHRERDSLHARRAAVGAVQVKRLAAELTATGRDDAGELERRNRLVDGLRV